MRKRYDDEPLTRVNKLLYTIVSVVSIVAALFYFFNLDPSDIDPQSMIGQRLQSAEPSPAPEPQSAENGGKLAPVLPRDGMLSIIGINVGQGDCTLVVTPLRRTMLIDAGEKEAYPAVSAYLNAAGIRRIDVLVATHPHSDHIGALRELLQNYEVDKIYMPNVDHDTNTYKKLLSEIDKQGKKINTAKAGMEIKLSDDTELFMLHPDDGEYDDINNSSIVLHLRFGETTALFMGDAGTKVEKLLLKNYESAFPADVLKVGHHGSSDASGSKFLSAVSPDFSLIYAGFDDNLNHPNKKVVERLERLKTIILSTKEHGTVALFGDGEKFTAAVQK